MLIASLVRLGGTYERAELPHSNDMAYIVCVLHARLRLWGHVLDYCAKRINGYPPDMRKSVVPLLLNELQRCMVMTALVKVDADFEITVYSPSGDAVDNMSLHGFQLSTVFGAFLMNG